MFNFWFSAWACQLKLRAHAYARMVDKYNALNQFQAAELSAKPLIATVHLTEYAHDQ